MTVLHPEKNRTCKDDAAASTPEREGHQALVFDQQTRKERIHLIIWRQNVYKGVMKSPHGVSAGLLERREENFWRSRIKRGQGETSPFIPHQAQGGGCLGKGRSVSNKKKRAVLGP